MEIKLSSACYGLIIRWQTEVPILIRQGTKAGDRFLFPELLQFT